MNISLYKQCYRAFAPLRNIVVVLQIFQIENLKTSLTVKCIPPRRPWHFLNNFVEHSSDIITMQLQIFELYFQNF